MTAAPTQAPTEAIRDAFAALIEPGSVFELRIPMTKNNVVSGYFDDLDAAARIAASYSGKAAAVYFTVNPVNPALLARAANRVKDYAKQTTADTEIARRRWLLIDCDPVRLTGISSTGDEHAAAHQRAKEILVFLQELGFPEGSIATGDSGNGAHIMAHIDEPNDDATRLVVERCLKALDLRFSDALVKVDTTVSNAARIWKTYGTVAGKGDSIPDRPHRLSRLIRAPDSDVMTPRAVLERLADLAPVVEQPTRKGGTFQDPGAPFDLDGWLSRHSIAVKRSGEWNGGKKHILERCPWNEEHQDNAAYIVQFPNGALAAGCHHDHCQGRGWPELRELFEPGYRERRNGHDERQNGSMAHDSIPLPESHPWPDPPAEEVYSGLAGDIVRAIEPHTESDPIALLTQILTMFGNLIGKGPHFSVEADIHALKLYVVMVGDTSKGRKGTSYGHAKRVFHAVDPVWTDNRIAGNAGSGEGVIWAIRDAIYKTEAIKEKGKIISYQEVMVDAGVDDKRLLLYEPEYGSYLRIMERDGSSLSGVVRKAWDTDLLSSLTKNSPARSTGAHVSIIGHVTADELRRYLDRTEAANGYGNRHLWLAVKRARVLPDGGRIQDVDLAPLVRRLTEAVEFSVMTGELRRDVAASRLWHAVYPQLSEGGLGMVGALTSRAEAQVMRLACLYALLDCSSVVRADHLHAALCLWDYSAASVRWIFGDALGDHDADAIVQALKMNAAGLTRQQISEEIFSRNRAASQINRALGVLVAHGLAHSQRDERDGPGRPSERWFAGPSR